MVEIQTTLQPLQVSAKLEGTGYQWLKERRLSLELHGTDILILSGPGLRGSLDGQNEACS